MTAAATKPNATLDGLEEIVAHLGAALMQSAWVNDQIIRQHVEEAHQIALDLFRAEMRK